MTKTLSQRHQVAGMTGSLPSKKICLPAGQKQAGREERGKGETMATAVKAQKRAGKQVPKFRNWGVTMRGIVVREARETYLVNDCREAGNRGLAEAWALREFLLTYEDC